MFKVGDKVNVSGDNILRCFEESSLKLVEPEKPEPKFKVGDRVKVIGFSNLECDTNTLGDIGEIDKVAMSTNYYFVKSRGCKTGLYYPESSLELVKEPDTFYCCFVEGSGGYSVKHETIEEAKTEAERLARQNQNKGKKVYILKAVEYAVVPESPVEWNKIGKE